MQVKGKFDTFVDETGQHLSPVPHDGVEIEHFRLQDLHPVESSSCRVDEAAPSAAAQIPSTLCCRLCPGRIGEDFRLGRRAYVADLQ